ncbi:MAG: metal ABC transporter substrate-binding protein [Pseudomonadota bacterium]
MRVLMTALLVLASGLASAEIRVAATTANLGMLSSTIGGEAVSVSVLAPPDRNVHYLEARPSMMSTLRRSDLVVAVGAGLEVGWLPSAIGNAGNGAIREGTDGYFAGSEHTTLIQQGQAADRSGGDVHPEGNPHFYMDPVKLAEVGHALADRLTELDPGNAETFRRNAESFEERARERVAEWQEQARDAPGVVLYHKDIDYLMERLDVPVHGYLEPLPGVEPTARHLSSLVSDLKDEEGVVLFAEFQPDRGARFLERELDWPWQALPTQVQPGDDAASYFRMIEQWVTALEPNG